MSQKTLNLCLERYNFVKFGETTKSSHTVLCTNNAYSVNSDKYRLTPTAIASKHGEGYVFTLNYDFDRPLFTIVQKSYSLDGTSGNIVFEGIDPISKGGSKYLRKVTVSPVKLSDGSYLLEVTKDEYLRIGTTGAALGDEELESLNEKIVTDGGITKSVETVGGKQVLKLDAGGPSGAKEIVYFDIDPSDPPSGIHTAIGEALSNNKLPVIKIDGAMYFYTATGTDKYVFVGGYTKEAVGYTEIEVSDDDSVTSKSVDDKVFNMYILPQDDPASPGETPSDEDQWVCDADKHVITKDELVAAHTDCRYFILNNAVEPDSNSRKYFASVTIISNSYIRLRFYMMQYDAQGVAEFYQKTVVNDSEGRLYILSSYSATLAGTIQAVLVSGPQSFDSAQKAQGRDNIGAASASDMTALQSQVSSLSDVSAYSVKGEATVAQLNAGPSGIQAGWAYQLTDSGTLTDGSLAVVAGDTVAWDGTKWFPLVKSDYYATKTYAQNVAHSIAPEFDPTKPNDAGGYAYYAGEIVSNNGTTYRFKVNHSSGAWNPAEVERYVAGESLKFFVVTDNPEYLYAVTDKDGRFISGAKKDGSVEWQKGVPSALAVELAKKVNFEVGKSLINSIFADGVIVTDNPEYLYAVTDKDGRFLFGSKKDGSFDWATGVPQPVKDYFAILMQQVADLIGTKVDKEVGKSLINSDFASVQSSITNPEFLQVLVDFQDKLLSALNHNGQHVFFSKPIFKGGIDWSKDNLTDLGKVLAEKGVMIGLGDWSNSQSLKMPLPNFGIVNINGSGGMPYTKTQDLNVEFEFWDLNGNYFKKPAVINAQGNSSLMFPKRNVAVDLLNADGSSFKLKIGDWVTQDSFHLKAYYTDITRVRALAGYYLFKEIMDAKDPRHDRTWKNALWKNTTYIGIGGGINADSNLKTQVDDGAVCFPLGFPIALYYNGAFYGIFCWQLKKHRDNYMMKKSDTKAIHLDGDKLGQAFFRYGTIDWTGFEVRNPKNLVCMDGTDYDGDDPKELIDSTSPYYDGTKKSHKNSKAVKESIIRLSQAYSVISQQPTTDEKKAKIAEYFDVDNLVDYQIFNDFIVNGDAFEKNWQWTTWDGEHWFVNPYDLDGMTGVRFTGNSVSAPPATYGGNQIGKPNWLVITYYQDALNSRYAQLRQSGILSVKNVMDKISKLVLAVGMDNYEKEFEKWPDTPCNNDLKVNTDYWEVEVDEAGNPIMNKEGVAYYDAQLEYNAGDECLYAVEQGVAAKYTMRCTNNTTGNPPVLVFAFRDSYERIINYLTLNEQLKDTLYGYQGGQL